MEICRGVLVHANGGVRQNEMGQYEIPSYSAALVMLSLRIGPGVSPPHDRGNTAVVHQLFPNIVHFCH